MFSLVYLGSSSSPLAAGLVLAVLAGVLIKAKSLAKWFPVLLCCCEGWWCYWYEFSFWMSEPIKAWLS